MAESKLQIQFRQRGLLPQTYAYLSRSSDDSSGTALVQKNPVNKALALDGDAFARLYAKKHNTRISENKNGFDGPIPPHSVDAIVQWGEKKDSRLALIEFKNRKIGKILSQTNSFEFEFCEESRGKSFEYSIRRKFVETLLMLAVESMPGITKPNEQIDAYIVVKGRSNGMMTERVRARGAVKVFGDYERILFRQIGLISEKTFEEMVLNNVFGQPVYKED